MIKGRGRQPSWHSPLLTTTPHHGRTFELSTDLTCIAALHATRGLLASDLIIWNHCQVVRTTPELASPLLTTPPHQQDDVSVLDRFNVYRYPTRRVLNGIGLELVTRQATIRYLDHWATTAPVLDWNETRKEFPAQDSR
ncbi:uncharacterized protein TNCV_2017251 [Trichonephila clavipes]|nr:uncharacterized protein TNCV_2017251 [Trichonephila clavipes]